MAVMAAGYRFGPFRLDVIGFRLLRDDVPVALSPKALDLLVLLASRPAALLSKDDIQQALWSDVIVTDNALTQVVSDLRQALGDSPAEPRYIQTVARRGYRFVAPVEAILPPPAEPAPSGTIAVDITRSAAHAPSAHPRRRSIFVGSFENLTGDRSVEWLESGIAETVANDLRTLGDLSVIDRSQLPDLARNASIEAARAGKLDLLVVGGYQCAAERLRITARVLDVRTGEAIAHAKADGAIGDVFQLQDTVVTQLSRALNVPVTTDAAARIGARETSSLEAYRVFTEGRLKLEALDPAQVPSAMADFNRAISLDSRYALAYVGRAHARFWRYEASRARNRPDTAELRAAIADIRRATELDPHAAEAHAALALFLTSANRTVEAVAAGRRAVALEPGNWRHLFRLGVAAWGGERLQCLERVVECYPEFPYAYFGLAMVHVARGDLATAEHTLRRGLTFEDDRPARMDRFPGRGLHWLLGLTRLAARCPEGAHLEFDLELAARGGELYAAEYVMDAYDGHGFAFLHEENGSQAAVMFSRALEIFPDHARSLVGLAEAHRRIGRTHESTSALEHAARAIEELYANERTTEAILDSAFLETVAGRRLEAIGRLDRLLADAPPGFAGWTIPIEPLFTPLLREPQFRAVLARLADRAR